MVVVVDLAPGSTFAGYRVQRLLGRGGMGAVYLVRAGDGTELALKVVRPDVADSEAFQARFEREGRLAASLEHPHLVAVVEAGEAEGTAYMALQYVDGTDLEALLASTVRLHPRHAADLVRQVAGALDAAHALGLVHRDVKPGNVLLEDAGGLMPHAYLSDFGLSKHQESTSGLTGTGNWVGTLDYAAPEQLQAQAVDARTDVYALGCVLFELLTGEVPFPRARPIDTLLAHVSDPPPVPSAFPGVPQALDPVVLRALAKDPQDRHHSAGELGADATTAAAEAGAPPAFPSFTAGAATDGDAPTAA
jgi:serine/threonine protein kinase